MPARSSSSILPLSFYRRDVQTVAAELLGQRLVVCRAGARCAGTIVEVESYLAEGDAACHGARKRTPRNEVMFAAGGVAYVYSIHSHFCFNVVTGRRDQPSAVLIRAMAPSEGLELMQARRGTERVTDLARGPGRLCRALGISRADNGLDLSTGEGIWIEAASEPGWADFQVMTTPRIGVTSAHDLLLRQALSPSPFVSGPKKWR